MSLSENLKSCSQPTCLRATGSGVEYIDRLPPSQSGCVKLCLSYNSITSLENITQFRRLNSLYMDYNMLTTFESLEPLGKLTYLKTLHLEGNPVCSLPLFQQHILKICPKLSVLNGKKTKDMNRDFSLIDTEAELIARITNARVVLKVLKLVKNNQDPAIKKIISIDEKIFMALKIVRKKMFGDPEYEKKHTQKLRSCGLNDYGYIGFLKQTFIKYVTEIDQFAEEIGLNQDALTAFGIVLNELSTEVNTDLFLDQAADIQTAAFKLIGIGDGLEIHMKPNSSLSLSRRTMGFNEYDDEYGDNLDDEDFDDIQNTTKGAMTPMPEEKSAKGVPLQKRARTPVRRSKNSLKSPKRSPSNSVKSNRSEMDESQGKRTPKKSNSPASSKSRASSRSSRSRNESTPTTPSKASKKGSSANKTPKKTEVVNNENIGNHEQKNDHSNSETPSKINESISENKKLLYKPKSPKDSSPRRTSPKSRKSPNPKEEPTSPKGTNDNAKLSPVATNRESSLHGSETKRSESPSLSSLRSSIAPSKASNVSSKSSVRSSPKSLVDTSPKSMVISEKLLNSLSPDLHAIKQQQIDNKALNESIDISSQQQEENILKNSPHNKQSLTPPKNKLNEQSHQRNGTPVRDSDKDLDNALEQIVMNCDSSILSQISRPDDDENPDSSNIIPINEDELKAALDIKVNDSDDTSTEDEEPISEDLDNLIKPDHHILSPTKPQTPEKSSKASSLQNQNTDESLDVISSENQTVSKPSSSKSPSKTLDSASSDKDKPISKSPVKSANKHENTSTPEKQTIKSPQENQISPMKKKSPSKSNQNSESPSTQNKISTNSPSLKSPKSPGKISNNEKSSEISPKKPTVKISHTNASPKSKSLNIKQPIQTKTENDNTIKDETLSSSQKEIHSSSNQTESEQILNEKELQTKPKEIPEGEEDTFEYDNKNEIENSSANSNSIENETNTYNEIDVDDNINTESNNLHAIKKKSSSNEENPEEESAEDFIFQPEGENPNKISGQNSIVLIPVVQQIDKSHHTRSSSECAEYVDSGSDDSDLTKHSDIKCSNQENSHPSSRSSSRLENTELKKQEIPQINSSSSPTYQHFNIQRNYEDLENMEEDIYDNSATLSFDENYHGDKNEEEDKDQITKNRLKGSQVMPTASSEMRLTAFASSEKINNSEYSLEDSIKGHFQDHLHDSSNDQNFEISDMSDNDDDEYQKQMMQLVPKLPKSILKTTHTQGSQKVNISPKNDQNQKENIESHETKKSISFSPNQLPKTNSQRDLREDADDIKFDASNGGIESSNMQTTSDRLYISADDSNFYASGGGALASVEPKRYISCDENKFEGSRGDSSMEQDIHDSDICALSPRLLESSQFVSAALLEQQGKSMYQQEKQYKQQQLIQKEIEQKERSKNRIRDSKAIKQYSDSNEEADDDQFDPFFTDSDIASSSRHLYTNDPNQSRSLSSINSFSFDASQPQVFPIDDDYTNNVKGSKLEPKSSETKTAYILENTSLVSKYFSLWKSKSSITSNEYYSNPKPSSKSSHFPITDSVTAQRLASKHSRTPIGIKRGGSSYSADSSNRSFAQLAQKHELMRKIENQKDINELLKKRYLQMSKEVDVSESFSSSFDRTNSPPPSRSFSRSTSSKKSEEGQSFLFSKYRKIIQGS